MPILGVFSSAEEQQISYEIKNELGVLTIGSDGSGVVNIEFWNGTGWSLFRLCGETKVLDSDNYLQKVNGVGIFRFTKPQGTPLIIYGGLDSSLRLRSDPPTN